MRLHLSKDAAEITAAQMQRIARELRGFVNEVVYLFPEDQRFHLMYYSAECEVDFCGHESAYGMHSVSLLRIIVRIKSFMIG